MSSKSSPDGNCDVQLNVAKTVRILAAAANSQLDMAFTLLFTSKVIEDLARGALSEMLTLAATREVFATGSVELAPDELEHRAEQQVKL